jgi:glycine/D-amino acid oxidase-like deaminating enzyme
MRSRNPDILIIGGGIAGISLAYYCAKEGLRVTVLEKNYLASGTSGANQGNLSIHARAAGIFLDINVECLEMFRTLKDELDFDIGYEEVSGLLVTDRWDHLKGLKGRVEELNRKGLHAEVLSRDELLKWEPHLSKNVRGGLFCRESACINSPRLVSGFAQAGRRLGVQIQTGKKAIRIRCQRGKVVGVETDQETFEADKVVIAAGAESKALARTAGISLPVELSGGVLMVTEPTAEIGSHIINEIEDGDGDVLSDSKDPVDRYKVRLVFSRKKSGNCLVGRSSESVSGDRCRTTPVVIETIGRNLCKFIPSFADIHLLRVFAGIRAISCDGLAILGPVEETEGLFLSAAHGDKGINTSPVVGKLLASWIATGQAPEILRPFSWNRVENKREDLS